jgi:hemoglobin
LIKIVGMNDLETREDIELLVNKFYQKIQTDNKIGLFFNDIAKLTGANIYPNV